MRGRLWLTYFTQVIKSVVVDYKKEWTSSLWTNFMGEVLDGVAEKMNCYVTRRRQNKKEESGEYFNIDGLFINNCEYALINEKNGWDPFVLPSAAVELENSYDLNKISYCLWKLMCIRTPIRVLICYQDNSKDVAILRKHLENVIWQGSLMKGTAGDVLIFIGDESVADDAPWEKYFSVFEWRNDRLEEIKEFDW
ncbi:MAG: hypothetical protein Q8M92_10965 [Candidatus Subteraquimicrobiales bacterium]|nr:hypothetical protein [Candidatus Subteraquimicrobiales bacterium]